MGPSGRVRFQLRLLVRLELRVRALLVAVDRALVVAPARERRLARRAQSPGTPLAYIGGYLVAPRLFADAPAGKFSMNLLWDRAIAKGRLHGIAHEGLWLHVGTPDAIALAEAQMKD